VTTAYLPTYCSFLGDASVNYERRKHGSVRVHLGPRAGDAPPPQRRTRLKIYNCIPVSQPPFQIRNSQTNCAENECFEDGSQSQDPQSSMLMMTCFFVAALFLYYFRPRTQRLSDDTNKPGAGNVSNPR
jgi:hypothetical protein